MRSVNPLLTVAEVVSWRFNDCLHETGLPLVGLRSLLVRGSIVRILLSAILCIVAVPVGALAEDATSFLDPTQWSVGEADSTYQEWDAFSSTSDNAPDIGYFPGVFAPTFSVASPGFVTGGQNLYSFSSDYDWWADVENHGGTGGTDVLVQTAATLNDGIGVMFDSLAIVQPNGSPILGGDNASVIQTTTLFEGDIWVEAMGQYVTSQERLWEFFLPGYTGDFCVEGTNLVHSSLMQVRVDSMIMPIPEPGTTVMMAMGLITLGACRILRRVRRRENRST